QQPWIALSTDGVEAVAAARGGHNERRGRHAGGRETRKTDSASHVRLLRCRGAMRPARPSMEHAGCQNDLVGISCVYSGCCSELPELGTHSSCPEARSG